MIKVIAVIERHDIAEHILSRLGLLASAITFQPPPGTAVSSAALGGALPDERRPRPVSNFDEPLQEPPTGP